MNWKREPETKETFTRAGFEAFVTRIIDAIALPETDGTRALETLKSQFSIDGDLNYTPFHSDDDQRWEHPLLTQHNRRQGSRGILNAGFFTLYARIVDYEESSYKFCGEVTVTPAHSEGYIQFVLGRVGNTFSVGRTYHVIADPPAVPDDSQGDLFAEVTR